MAQKAGVDVTAITEMAIWGNHSSRQYPDFYHAKINGQAVTDVITDINWLQQDFIATVQQRGAAVIKTRGSSSAASAANAALSTVYQLTHDTAPGEIFSVPCRTENGTLKVITGLTQNAFGQEKIQLTLNELRAERDAVRELKLL